MLLPPEVNFISKWCDPPEDYGCRVVFQGDVFRGLRQARGISQIDAARWFGVSRQTISAWEHSKSLPNRERLIQICKKFACPFWCLVIPKPKPKPMTETEKRQIQRDDKVRKRQLIEQMKFEKGLEARLDRLRSQRK